MYLAKLVIPLSACALAAASLGCTVGVEPAPPQLPDGSYTADVTLVDSAGNSRSVTKPLQAIEVVAGTDLAIDVDFPSSSIL
jgi:hypothetical protein